MYEKLYGLTEEPFNITPDPKFLYLSKKHEGGLEHLLYGVERKKGLIVLTGEVGTGKTILLNAIVQRIDEKTHIAFLVNSQMSSLDIYKYIFHEFGLQIEIAGKTESDLFILLKDFSIQCLRDGKNCVLIFDEAQNLSHEVLEQIRLLLNFETHDRKLIQIILVGHPELHEKLNLLESAKLKQRVSIFYHLLPLDDTETKGYIEKRLSVAGARQPIFTEEAFAEIYGYAQGIPRLINMLCDLALFLGFQKKQPLLDRDIILQAEQLLHMRAPQTSSEASLALAQEEAPQASAGRQPMPDEPSQALLPSSEVRVRQDVLAGLPPSSDRADAPAAAQTSRRGRRFWRPSLGGVAVGIILSLIAWGGFIPQTRVSRGAETFFQTIWQLFSTSPSALQSAPHPASAERVSMPSQAPGASPQVFAPGLSPHNPSASETPQMTRRLTPAPQEEGSSPARPQRAENQVRALPGSPAAAPHDPAPPQSFPPAPHVVVVQAGDTLGEIILRTYKRFDSRLLTLVQEANPNLTNPSRIDIGQRLVLPAMPQ